MLAKFFGGPLDGQEAQVEDGAVVVIMPITKTSHPWRYVRTSVEPDGVAHFTIAGLDEGTGSIL